ncbi:HAD family hydrolase [Clostridium sp. Marseille-P2415]|uniref:HAD family hydrolase n=1 Tax=Clostridium sp. Marseille-P2415 TaxID=1805471 RepID=UPI0009888217|nr:HAD family hydrolase [Clostridium sp. Marseille-P2415]
MTEKRKALFFDIDGTLFSEVNRNVPDSAKQAVARAREKGHLVFINSGRTDCQIELIKRMIEVDGYCCGCGTRIVAEGQVLFSATIPHERGLKIKKIILEHGLDGILEGTESCYFRKEPSRIPQVERMKETIAREGNISPYGWEEDCYDFDKFCVLADEKSDMKGFSRALGLDFEIISRGGGFYECVPAGYSKATAMELVLKHYGIALEDTYVFGDSTNDLSMFEYAKNCILMGHHSVELEPYATFYTKNVEDDGVAYAMKKLGLV